MSIDLDHLSSVLGDRYTLDRELGRGGMATVYLANDRKHDRQVAIKVLHPELSVTLAAERFLREIQIEARLNHPHIVPLHDSGQTNGFLYYVMPYVEGESLRQLVDREETLPVNDAVRIAVQVASALDYAHGHDVLHRDIKPENILLSAGEAVVADFGIARAIAETATRRLTATGTTVGTALYMSPEQATGETTLDGRADQYSLACVLYEMLVGEAPFAELEKRQRALLTAKQTETPPPLVSLGASVPEALDATIGRAFAPAAEDRWPDIREFAEALESSIGGHTPTAFYRATPRPMLRRKLPLAKLAVASLGLVAVLGALWINSRGTAEPVTTTDVAVDTSHYMILPFEYRSGADLQLNEVVLLQDALDRWSGVSVVDPFQVREALGRRDGQDLTTGAAADLSRGLGAGRYLRGEVSRVGDSLRVHVALYGVLNLTPIDSRTARLPLDGRGAEASLAAIADHLLFRGREPAGAPELTTRSRPARLQYIRGEDALQSWNLVDADSAFSAATSLDPDYSRAHLWLALVRAWKGDDPARWRVAAQQADLGAERFSDRDRAIAEAVLAHSSGDLARACDLWLVLTRRQGRDFAAWYGLAHCLASDDVVLPNSGSPSGWSFRTSSHQALTAYQRAFQLLPSILSAFQGASYEALKDLFMVEGNQLRYGQAAPPDTLHFSADPAWRGDTLALVPYPILGPETDLLTANPAESEKAVRQLRLLFRDVALSWVGSAPGNADAYQALAIALGLLGDSSGLDTLRRARSLVTDRAERQRIAGSEVWMQVALALPGNEAGLARARALADSLLSGSEQYGPVDPRLGAGLAALTGRASRSAAYSRAPQAADAYHVPARIRETAPPLLVFAALGGPADSLLYLEEQVRSALDEARLLDERPEPYVRWLTRPATLAFPSHQFADFRGLVGRGDDLLDLQAAFAEGDSGSVRRVLAQWREDRREYSPATLTLDALCPEAHLLAAIGEPRQAADWLDPTLRALPEVAPHLLASPERAASLVRAAALRATLAEQLGDLNEARLWAKAVIVLWSDADDFLEPLLSEMRRISG